MAVLTPRRRYQSQQQPGIRTAVKLREYCEQKLEALGLPARVKLDLDDGSTIEILHPWLWDDKTQAAVNAAQTTTDTAKAIIGAPAHKRLAAAGGSSNEILFVVETMKRKIDGSSDKDGADPKGN